MPKGINEIAFETRKIIELMAKAPVGSTITWSAILEETGLASREACRGYVATALRTLRREGAIFDTVRGEGYRRMSDEEIATQRPAMRRRKLRKQAREMVKDVAAIQDFSALSDEAQLSVYVAQTEAALVEKATGRSAETAIRDASRAKREQLAIGESLRLLMVT